MQEQELTTAAEEPQVEVPQPKTPAEPVSPVVEEKPSPSRVKSYFNKMIIWLAVVIIAFLAGMVTDHFWRYKTLNETLLQTQTELTEVQEEIKQVQALKDAITSLEEEKEQLAGDLATSQDHLGMLQMLVDTNSARLALFLDDVPGAQEALADTANRLEVLKGRIAEYDEKMATSMPQRLSLIISGLDGDIETATIDLELFTKNLIEVESALFSQ